MMFGISPATGSVRCRVRRFHPGTPRGVFYAANSHGSLPHLTGEMLRQQTGANITIPYPGALQVAEPAGGGSA
jgi:hypothetical protein